MFEPSYQKLSESGELKERIEKAYKILEECSLCPRKCKVDRLNGELGYCKSGRELIVSSFGPHFGEEPPLVGRFGSGTIFLTNCNLGCLYCQNYDISHLGQGEEVSLEELAGQMLSLQKRGCHNINFVTPTHFVPQIIASLSLAIGKGLNIPLVYNCGGYESLEVLKLLEGIFDIYMPDIKYANEEVSKKYSNAGDYPRVVKETLLEMQRQVGDLIIDERGIAQRGLLIRHLVLPSQLAGTKEIMHFIGKEISPSAYVNIMDQYRPCHKAINYPQVSRGTTREEYVEAIEIASQEGLSRGFSLELRGEF